MNIGGFYFPAVDAPYFTGAGGLHFWVNIEDAITYARDNNRHEIYACPRVQEWATVVWSRDFMDLQLRHVVPTLVYQVCAYNPPRASRACHSRSATYYFPSNLYNTHRCLERRLFLLPLSRLRDQRAVIFYRYLGHEQTCVFGYSGAQGCPQLHRPTLLWAPAASCTAFMHRPVEVHLPTFMHLCQAGYPASPKTPRANLRALCSHIQRCAAWCRLCR